MRPSHGLRVVDPNLAGKLPAAGQWSTDCWLSWHKLSEVHSELSRWFGLKICGKLEKKSGFIIISLAKTATLLRDNFRHSRIIKLGAPEMAKIGQRCFWAINWRLLQFHTAASKSRLAAEQFPIVGQPESWSCYEPRIKHDSQRRGQVIQFQFRRCLGHFGDGLSGADGTEESGMPALVQIS